MSKEPTNIDRLVKEKLDGFEMTPPASVWNNTAAALGSGRKRRFFMWFFLGFFLIASAGTGIYLMNADQLEKTEPVQQASNKKVIQDTTAILKKLDRDGEDIDLLNDGSLDHETASETTSSSTKQTTTNSSTSSDNNAFTFKGKRNQFSSQSSKNNSTLNNDDHYDDDDNDRFNSNNLNQRDSNDTLAQEDQQNNSPDINQDSSLDSDSQNGEKSSYLQMNALEFLPVTLFNPINNKSIESQFEEGWAPETPVFRRKLSLEGSFGVSTFNNKPAKNSGDPEFITLLSEAASNRISYDYRFGINYHFANRLSFQSGVHYNMAREDYSYDEWETTTYTYTDTISFTVDTTTMDTTYVLLTYESDSTTLQSKFTQNTYTLITIPFQFGWTTAINARSNLEFTLGGELSVYGRNTGVVIFSENNDLLPADGAYHTSGMLSVGGSVKYLYRFGNHHSVYVEPWAQFGITNQYSQQLNYESLRQRYGIRFGYRFYF